MALVATLRKCARVGCVKELEPNKRGRPKEYCGDACRIADDRDRKAAGIPKWTKARCPDCGDFRRLYAGGFCKPCTDKHAFVQTQAADAARLSRIEARLREEIESASSNRLALRIVELPSANGNLLTLVAELDRLTKLLNGCSDSPTPRSYCSGDGGLWEQVRRARRTRADDRAARPIPRLPASPEAIDRAERTKDWREGLRFDAETPRRKIMPLLQSHHAIDEVRVRCLYCDFSVTGSKARQAFDAHGCERPTPYRMAGK